jgi:hypothetical protein
MGPMALDSATALRLPMPDGHLLGFQDACFLAPDGPSFELDKPPLI